MYIGRSSLTNQKYQLYLIIRVFKCVGEGTRPIEALKYRLQVEEDHVEETGDGPVRL